MSPVSEFRVALPVAREAAFAWHAAPGALERLSPPWRAVRVRRRTGGLADGAQVTLEGGFPVGRWTAEHFGTEPPVHFRDRQVAGPFARWEHLHEFVPAPGDASACTLIDRIEWQLPAAPFSALAHGFVQQELRALFAWRHRVLARDLTELATAPPLPRVVAVTGASGLIGSALTAYLGTQGCTVRRFVRRAARDAHEIAWDPARGTLDPAALADVDAVVHLAGAGIADARWTEARKRELVESRIASTRTLVRALVEARGACRVLVSASAVGVYGDRGDAPLEDASPPGRGFLADLALAWEDAAAPAARAGMRVAHPRIGIVLWPQGGALAPMLPLFAFGAGGPLGSGRQWWSWVTLHDLLGMLRFALVTPALSGPFAAVAPQTARMGELAHALGRVLRRPSLLPAPAFALRLVLGREMADGMLLASQRLRPAVLERLGFAYRDPQLEPALRALLGRDRLTASAVS